MQLTTKLEKQIERFVNSDFKEGYFTKDIYTYLYIYNNNFIAHFDRKGFYSARFKDIFGKLQTIKLIETRSKPGDKIAACFIKHLKQAKSARSKRHHESVVYNYAGSFGAGLRNAVDPADPDALQYSQDLHKRLQDVLEYANKNNVDASVVQAAIASAVASNLDFLTSGFLTSLRASIGKRA